MSDTTGIEWTDHTGGPYLGCAPVSPGCANCYAWELALTRLEPIFRKAYNAAGFADWKTRPVWGPKATRVLSKGFWHDARRLNARHEKDGTRGRWFPSMIDWLDDMPGGIIDQDGRALDPVAVLARFLALVHETKYLDWLLLTKRPENWARLITQAAMSVPGDVDKFDGMIGMVSVWVLGKAPENVWIGVSVEDQTRADERRDALRAIPAKVLFVSYEPALGDVDWTGWTFLHWLISGGESGPGSRTSHPYWHRHARDFCAANGIKYFFKQWGDWLHTPTGFAAPRGKGLNIFLTPDGRKNDGSGPGSVTMSRVGKKEAGSLLDGVEHKEFPA